jgi:hypothetical protein
MTCPWSWITIPAVPPKRTLFEIVTLQLPDTVSATPFVWMSAPERLICCVPEHESGVPVVP